MKEFSTYILRCSDKSLYTGVTNSLELRVSQHQEGINPNCYTYTRRPVELVYTATYTEIADAIAWEKKKKME